MDIKQPIIHDRHIVKSIFENMKRAGIICGLHYSALHQNAVYNKEDTMINMLKHGHYGPWDLNDGLKEGK